MYLYLAPKIIGDQKARSSVVGLELKDINKAIQLRDINIQQIGKDIFIEGYVHRYY